MRPAAIIFTAMMMYALCTKSSTIISIDKALEKRMMKAEVVCTGGLEVNYSVKNETGDSLKIVMPAGWRMNSVKEEYQDILVTREQVLALAAHQVRSFSIKGFCCEASHSGPVKGAKYDAGRMASPHLVLLASWLQARPVDENTAQYAVWAVSDNRPTANITGGNDSLAGLLRNFVASVKGEPVPWYTLLKRVSVSNSGAIHEAPLRLKGDVNYSVNHSCYAWFFITDEKGNKVGRIDGQWLTPGSKAYAVNVDLRNFKKGKYKVVLASNGEEFINKAFEI